MGSSLAQQAKTPVDEEAHQWLVVGKSGTRRSLKVDGRDVEVIVCGITPRLETPLVWLHSQMRNPDHFLYIVLQV